MTKKKDISEREQRRRHRQSVAQLLYDRTTTAHMLGDLSTSTLIRLEASGQLVAVKPSGRDNGKTYYTSQSVHRLAGVEQAAEVA